MHTKSPNESILTEGNSKHIVSTVLTVREQDAQSRNSFLTYLKNTKQVSGSALQVLTGQRNNNKQYRIMITLYYSLRKNITMDSH